MAQPVDLLVDRHLLVDERVRLLDVRLRLVVVVVGDEVLDGVVREQLAELLVQLGRERLVVGQDESGLIERLGDPRDGVGLPGAGDAEEGLPVGARLEPLHELRYRLRLVARGLERGVDAEGAVDGRTVLGEGGVGVAHDTRRWRRRHLSSAGDRRRRGPVRAVTSLCGYLSYRYLVTTDRYSRPATALRHRPSGRAGRLRRWHARRSVPRRRHRQRPVCRGP